MHSGHCRGSTESIGGQEHAWELYGEVSDRILVGETRAASKQQFRQSKFWKAVAVLGFPMDLDDSPVFTFGFIQPTLFLEKLAKLVASHRRLQLIVGMFRKDTLQQESRAF